MFCYLLNTCAITRADCPLFLNTFNCSHFPFSLEPCPARIQFFISLWCHKMTPPVTRKWDPDENTDCRSQTNDSRAYGRSSAGQGPIICRGRQLRALGFACISVSDHVEFQSTTLSSQADIETAFLLQINPLDLPISLGLGRIVFSSTELSVLKAEKDRMK